MKLGSLFLLGGAVIATGCGSTPHGSPTTVSTPVPAAPKPAAPSAPAAAPARHAVTREPQLVGGASLFAFRGFGFARAAVGDRSNRLPLVAPGKKGARGDVREIYQKVAPAVVIIHAGDAMGSGVIIRKDGWLLTNYHVVESGELSDLYMKVGVELGQMKNGSMERTNKVLTATVQAVDRARDVALVKIDSPPGELPFVKLTDQPVAAGEPVASIGHASIGLLWAIKDGEISAIGNVADDRALAELVLAPCSQDMATHDPEVCDQRRRMVDAEREQLEKSHAGLVIQTTCDIWHGDSGGPLVDHAGQLVGLNDFGYSDPDGGAHSNFHVHVNEIRTFLEHVPAQPRRWIPDPFAVQGVAKYGDLDGDGTVDTLGVSSQDELALLFDLGQHTTEKYDDGPADALEKHEFVAPVAFVKHGEVVSVLYDTNGDGTFDVLLVDKDGRGTPGEAYRIQGDQVTKDDTLVKGGDIRPELLQNGAERQRLTAIVRQAFGADFLGPSVAASGEAAIPDPTWTAALTATGEDHDKDGTPDAYRVGHDWDSGLLVDPDQRSTPGDDALAALHAGKIEARASLVDRPDGRFAFYDTKGTGSYDLLLHAAAGSDVVDQGYDLQGTQLGNRRVDVAGQLLIQPALAGTGAPVHARAAAAFGLAAQAADPGLGAFPDPGAIARASDIDFAPVPHWDRAVIAADNVILVDTNQGRARRRKGTAAETLAHGPFPAQLAYLNDRGTEYFFYDTAGAGRFDLVLVAFDPPSGAASIGYRLAKDGRPTVDPKLEGEKLVRPSLFHNRTTAAAIAQIAKAMFNARAIGR